MGVPGRVFSTEHFRVYTTESSPSMFERLAPFLEAALVEYTTAYVNLPMPREVMVTYLMGSNWQWRRITQELMGTDAPTYLAIQRGGFAARGSGVYYSIGQHDTFAIAAHEGWHQYTQSAFRDPLPVWLEEGIAARMEGFRWDSTGRRPVFLGWANLERYDQLRASYASDELMSLDELLRASPQALIATDGEATLAYYAQVWALTHFLWEGAAGKRRDSFRLMLEHAAQGRLYDYTALVVGSRHASIAQSARSGSAAFEAYFGGDVAGLSAEYDAFVRALVEPENRTLIMRGVSPVRSN